MTHDPHRSPPPATRLELVVASPVEEPPERPKTRPEKKGAPAEPADAKPLRPVHRPPMALLCAVDDGLERGEWFRLRRPRTVVGRVEGDVVVPHDDAMSGKHLEIVRAAVPGGFRWVIRDLGSTNGTFFRVSGGLLRAGMELLLGSRRYRFDLPLPERSEQPSQDQTRMWQTANLGQAAGPRPTLTELIPGGASGKQFVVATDDISLGRSAQQCDLSIADDPFVSPRHARVFSDKRGHWQIENVGGTNGVWVRVEEMPIENSGEFMAGEQRFLFKVL